jgi:4-aminobutyrate aminotransferase
VEGGLVANAAAMGERIMAGLRALAARHVAIGDVRGRGLMIGLELVADRVTRAPAESLVLDVERRAFAHGLLVLAAGRSTLRLAPPLLVDEVDVDAALAILDRCLAELAPR